MSNRTIVYIDGLNFYYGALSNGPYKWLNLDRYFTLLRPHDDIQAIHFFTAIIDGPRKLNQQTYLRAIETCPRVNVIRGRFKSRQMKCRVAGCTYSGSRMFARPEEKRTDVNIAVQIVEDVFLDRCDTIVLVSGDSDLVPALHVARRNFPGKNIVLYVPARDPIRGAAVELRSAADKDKTLPLALLKRAQFPSRVPDGSGGFIEKPNSW